ncbi:MAG: Tol-Pal system beta propeller repeat protein TolB [Gammaproteobacteria bacterium]
MINNKFLQAALAGIVLFVSGNVRAVLEIEITKGVEGALPIAIVPFDVDGGSAASSVDNIVSSDLGRSGYFKLVADKQFPQRPRRATDLVFQQWRSKGIENVVIGKVTTIGPGQFNIQFQLFDTVQSRQLIGYDVPTTTRKLRAAAHKISDLIFEALTGLKGAFSTRVAYVSTVKQSGGPSYVLQIADADGFGPRTVFKSRQPLMSPAWSPDGKHIAYVSFEAQRPHIYVQNLVSGARTKVSGKPGINSAPSWSPDGGRLAMTLSAEGNPELYVMDIGSKKLVRLTRSRGIDTEPSWMPDGLSLVFTSDRSGKPQLYKVAAGGGGRPRRLTFDGSYNADADVSPNGKKIAMVHGTKSGYRIAVMELATGELRVLTDGHLDEAPSFAPNGSMIIYATENGGRGVLSAVSEDGRVKQRLRLQEGDVREPVWSPFGIN